MKTLKKVFLFLLALELVFVIHEYGHYTEFIKRDIPVQEFSIGIGPAIYQHRVDELTISLRLIPVMAYVAPNEEGYKMQTENSFLDKFIISSAGVRNNLFSGVGVVLLLNLISWGKGTIGIITLIRRTICYPIKVLYIFVLFFLDSLSFRRFSLGKNCKLYSGLVRPPKVIEAFISLSFFIGCLNFLPFYPLDGGKTFIEIISYFLDKNALNIVQTASQFALYFFLFGYGVSEMEFVDYDEFIE